MSHPSIWLAARLPQTLLCALATFALTYVALQQGDEVIRDQRRAEALGWLDSIGLGSHKELILSHGERLFCTFQTLEISCAWAMRHTLVGGFPEPF